jgi:MFS family permease
MNTDPKRLKENLSPISIESGSKTKANTDDKENNFNGLNLDFPKFRSVHRPFGKFKRKIIFFLIFVINLLINIDHGAIPASTTILKRELHLDNVALGVIGSLVYLGLVLGSISAGPIFTAYSPKWVVTITLIISCLFLYFFTVSEIPFFLSFCRVGCGFFQVIIILIRFSVTYIFLFG